MSRRAPRRRTSRPSAGVHLLHDPAVVRSLIRSARPRTGDHVYDLGAGPGVITAALAATGARVTAVERDPTFAQDLRRRFADRPEVRVLAADLRVVRVPRTAQVVANIPFACSGAVLARLLDPPGTGRAGVDLLVERGFALRAAAAIPRSPAWAWRAARYDLRLTRTVPRTAFGPPPRVDAAHLRIRARPPLGTDGERCLRLLLHGAYDPRPRSARTVTRRAVGPARTTTLLRDHGLEPDTPAQAVPAALWGAIARDATSAG